MTTSEAVVMFRRQNAQSHYSVPNSKEPRQQSNLETEQSPTETAGIINVKIRRRFYDYYCCTREWIVCAWIYSHFPHSNEPNCMATTPSPTLLLDEPRGESLSDLNKPQIPRPLSHAHQPSNLLPDCLRPVNNFKLQT